MQAKTSGDSQGSAGEKFGVSRTAVTKMSKAMEFRNKILADYSSDLSAEVIMSLKGFKASNGWLHRYMKRRRMRSLPKMKHEPTHGAMLADKINADDRVQRVRELLLTNLDEITMRHRSTSMILDSILNMVARSLERISIAVAMSATGEKLYLQVVGKDPRPESLRGIDPLTSFRIQYRDNGRAAHDVHAISDFIHAMNHEAKMRKQVWYLVLDTCTAHVATANALQSSGSIQTGFIFELIVLPGVVRNTSHTCTPSSTRSFVVYIVMLLDVSAGQIVVQPMLVKHVRPPPFLSTYIRSEVVALALNHQVVKVVCGLYGD
ncbi:hypothetical protein PsorP6_006501 [Peronosclerospora sorghi]|uniref:Uncharacterized protein n=1 Tax=Peronosclerospora sorghi TaxID=230839 RepID=A0ACC0W5S2_9STRA|nr:hypothetical protein PsorP6_006501 [Peronosclerospora sorghi]